MASVKSVFQGSAEALFIPIETELGTLQKKLADDLAIVTRLTDANSGEYISSPSTTRKLCSLLANETPEFSLTQPQIERVYTLLRRYSSIPHNHPRMSSLPPTPQFSKSLDGCSNNGLPESRSVHDIPHYVIHEDIDCQTQLLLDESYQSATSISTMDTSMSSARADSLPPSDTHASLVVDIGSYVAREWRGDTEKAQLIRKVSGNVVWR